MRPGSGEAVNLKEHFGDSYDLVKRFLLRELSVLGRWQVQPMFTAEVTAPEAEAFAKLLGAPLLSIERLTRHTDRGEYFRPCLNAGHLLLDPDKGLRLQEGSGHRSPLHLFGSELEEIARARPKAVTAVFDQSFQHGSGTAEVQHKLSYFGAHGIHGFAYVSHASFLFFSLAPAVIASAKSALAAASMPEARLLQEMAA